MKLLIDWSVVCHICWHKMRSPDYEAKTDIEQVEFSRNLATWMAQAIFRFNPDEVVIAMDGPNYWRYGAFNKYYSKHLNLWRDVEKVIDPDTKEEIKKVVYYMEHDFKMYRIEYHTGMEKFLRTKLKKAEILEIKQQVSDRGIPKIHPVKEDTDPHPDLESIKKLFPQYKGSRGESTWDFVTSREEFKRMCNNIGNNLAHTLTSTANIPTRVLQVLGAEADDIAHVYQAANPAIDLVYVTTDSDWHQMLRTHMFLKFFDPRKAEWVDKTNEMCSFDLAIKIISGDTSDGIPGITLLGKDGSTVGKKTAEEIVQRVGVKDIYNHLKEVAEPESLKRNYQLIFLGNCPSVIRNEIHKAMYAPIKEAQKVYTWSQYGVDPQEMLSIEGTAKELRSRDVEQGYYGVD